MGIWESQELLESLATSVGCNFLSDLRQRDMLTQVQSAAVRIPAETYSVKEWTDAVHYILCVQEEFGSAEQAKEYLIQQKK